MTLNNFIFGSNQIVYIQFSNFVAICMFWHNFCVFVFDEICGHISTYISSQLNLADVKFNISPIQTQMEGPLILEPSIYKIFWRIGSLVLSHFHIFRLSAFFVTNHHWFGFQTSPFPFLNWTILLATLLVYYFTNLTKINICRRTLLATLLVSYFTNLTKINVCRRILLALLDIGTHWAHCSVSVQNCPNCV